MLVSPGKPGYDHAASYELQLDRVGELNSTSVKNEALIRADEKRADGLEKQVDDLHSKRAEEKIRLEGLQRLLEKMQQQEALLVEEIRAGEQFASCFKMRSMIGATPDDPDWDEDATTREAVVERTVDAASKTQGQLQRFGNMLSQRALEEELAVGGDLARYARDTASLALLVRKVLESHTRESFGGVPSDGAPPLAECAGQLHRALEQHRAPNVLGRSLAHLALARLEAVRAARVAITSGARVATAPAAAAPDVGAGPDAIRDGDAL